MTRAIKAAPSLGKIASTMAAATRSEEAFCTSFKREHQHVGGVGQRVETNDEDRAQGQGERHVALRLSDFSCDEGDVVPGVGREHRANLGDAERDEQAETVVCERPGAMGVKSCGVHALPKLAFTARARQPTSAQNDHAQKRADLGGGEGVLNDLAVLDAAGVGPSEQEDQQHADQLGRGQRERVAAGDMDRRDEIVAFGNARPQHAEIAREADGHGRYRAGLDDEKERPAVEESAQRRPGFLQINILASGMRHHGRQLAIRQRGGDGQQPGDDPGGEQPSGAAKLPRHFRRDDEDAGTDHGSGNDHGGIEQPEAMAQVFGVYAGSRSGQASVRTLPRCSSQPIAHQAATAIHS